MNLENNKLHYAIAGLLGMVGVVILAVFVTINSQGNETTTLVNITNSTPTLDSVKFHTSTSSPVSLNSFNLNENTTARVYVYGSLTDNNGCNSIVTGGALSAVLYRSGVGPNCAADPLNCYTRSYGASTCSIYDCTGPSDVSANYECAFDVYYYSDATDSGTYSAQDWIAYASVSDSSFATSTASTTFEMNTLTAINVGPSIDYGYLGLGDLSDEETLLITNTGNKTPVDVNLAATDMGCTVGTIGATNQHYSTSTGAVYGAMTAATNALTYFNLDLTKQNNKNMYWKLQMPSSGLSGTCMGTTTIVAL